ncbi:MAG: hypothetical protein GY792_03965, partial [Gammaproteobacteria bacterium]|nr:hypothetical protein [Gammaproteobacteria bacterium]
MPLEVVLYRYYNRNGTSKDWVYPMAVTRTDAELIVYYGRTGSLLRHAVTPAAQCRAHDPRAEAEHRAEEKVRKGYIYQGRYQLSDNRRELWPLTEATPRVSSSTMAAATETETTPCWYWLNRVPSNHGPVPDEAQAARMAVIDVLDHAALPIPDTPDPHPLVKGLVEGKEATGCVELTADNAP